MSVYIRTEASPGRHPTRDPRGYSLGSSFSSRRLEDTMRSITGNTVKYRRPTAQACPSIDYQCVEKHDPVLVDRSLHARYGCDGQHFRSNVDKGLIA